MARPSGYSVERGEEICRLLADGISLKEICAADGKPDRWTVYQWVKKYPKFKIAYDEARAFQADTLVDEMLDIADNAQNDYMERIGREGQSMGWVENGEAVRRSALRVDTRKHLAGLLSPRKYGARVINEVGGIDGAPIEVATVSTRDLAKATALLLARGMKAKAEG